MHPLPHDVFSPSHRRRAHQRGRSRLRQRSSQVRPRRPLCTWIERRQWQSSLTLSQREEDGRRQGEARWGTTQQLWGRMGGPTSAMELAGAARNDSCALGSSGARGGACWPHPSARTVGEARRGEAWCSSSRGGRGGLALAAGAARSDHCAPRSSDTMWGAFTWGEGDGSQSCSGGGRLIFPPPSRYPSHSITVKLIGFFERTAQDSACFIDIAEKKKQDYDPGDHRQEKKKEEKLNSPGWIGTSTRVTSQLYALAGWIGTSTRPGTLHTTTTEETKHNRRSTHRPHTSR
jgi:hypothetical protein